MRSLKGYGLQLSGYKSLQKTGRTGRVRGTYELVIHDLPFIVAYRIKKEEVQILSVYHTSRKWPEKLN